MNKKEFFSKYEIIVKIPSYATVRLCSDPAGLEYESFQLEDDDPIYYSIYNKETGDGEHIFTNSDEVLIDTIMKKAVKEKLFIKNWQGIKDTYPWLCIPDEIKDRKSDDRYENAAVSE
jgi:hypothetical protein